jgi:hypothetical protein
VAAGVPVVSSGAAERSPGTKPELVLSPDEFLERLTLLADAAAIDAECEGVLRQGWKGPTSVDAFRLEWIIDELQQRERDLPLPHLRRLVEEGKRLLPRVKKYKTVLVRLTTLERRWAGLAAEVRVLAPEAGRLRATIAALRSEEQQARAWKADTTRGLDEVRGEFARSHLALLAVQDARKAEEKAKERKLAELENAAKSARAEVLEQIKWRDQLREAIPVLEARLRSTREELGALEHRVKEREVQANPLAAPVRAVPGSPSPALPVVAATVKEFTDSRKGIGPRAVLARPAPATERSGPSGAQGTR